MAALALGRNSRVKVLEATVGCGKDTLVLAPRGGRQDDVGEHGRLRHKDVLADEQVQLGERLAHTGRIGLGLNRVLAIVVEAVHLALVDQVAQVGELIALLERELFLGHAPSLGKLGASGGVGDFLVARVQVRQHAHIAGALDVILTAHGREAGVGFADLPATQAMEAMVCTVFRFCFCWHTPMPQPMMAEGFAVAYISAAWWISAGSTPVMSCTDSGV